MNLLRLIHALGAAGKKGLTIPKKADGSDEYQIIIKNVDKFLVSVDMYALAILSPFNHHRNQPMFQI